MLGELLHDLGDDEPIYGLQHHGVNLWSAHVRSGRWYDVARWLSGLGGGLWFPKRDGVTWVCGRRVEVLLDPDGLRDLVDARLVCESLGVPVGSSVGGCCRELLAWVGPRQWAEKGLYARYHPELFGYHDCMPGEYDQVDYYDVRSAYFSLLQRLPSVRVSLASGGLVWHGWGSGEEERWRSVLGAVAGCKVVRNTLWGAMVGGTQPVRAFCRGREVLRPGRLGPFRPAGLVVGRSMWELTCLASHEVGSVLSNTDSVCAVGGLWPSVWSDFGLEVSSKASGDAEVYHWGSYRIGPRATVLYREGSRTPMASPRREISDGRLVYRALRAAV